MKDQPKELSGVTLARIHLLSTRIIGKLMKEAGVGEVGPEQARILNILWRVDVTKTPPISIGILARETQLSKPTLTIMLNRLEKNGYVTKIPSEKDRRVVLVKRTGKDRHLEKVYDQIGHRMSEICFRGFTPTEVEQYENYLKRILNNLINAQEKPSRTLLNTKSG